MERKYIELFELLSFIPVLTHTGGPAPERRDKVIEILREKTR